MRMNSLLGLINSDFAEVDAYSKSIFDDDECNNATDTIAEISSLNRKEFALKCLSAEFSAAAIQHILRQFNRMDAKESSASLTYMKEHLRQSCDEILKPKIESFILRLLERFSDFGAEEKALIIAHAIEFIELFQSSDIALKLIQTIRKILSNLQGGNMPELTMVFKLVLLSNITHEGPSQSSSICSHLDSESVLGISECIVNIFLNGTFFQKQIIIDQIYDCVILKNFQPSPSGFFIIDKLLRTKDNEAIIELKLLALRYIYGLTDSKVFEEIPFNFPNDELRCILIFGDILNYCENLNMELKNNKLLTSRFIQFLASTGGVNVMKNTASIVLKVEMFDEPVLVLKQGSNHSCTYIKFAAQLLQINGAKSLFLVKFLFENSTIAKTSDVIHFLRICISTKADFIPLLEIIMKLKQIIETEKLDESLAIWIADNFSEQSMIILKLLQMHHIDIKKIIETILEKNDDINQYLSPFISEDLIHAFLKKLTSIDNEPHSLRCVVRMLLSDGCPEQWEKLATSLVINSQEGAITILAVFNEQIGYGNAKAVSSGLSTIQRLVKNATQSKCTDKHSKKIVESTIQNLKIYSTKINALTSFHIGNLKLKRTRVDESG